jgi:hypothetical protein
VSPPTAKELLREGVACLLSGDLDTGKAILRDYINATIGFDCSLQLERRRCRLEKSALSPAPSAVSPACAPCVSRQCGTVSGPGGVVSRAGHVATLDRGVVSDAGDGASVECDAVS